MCATPTDRQSLFLHTKWHGDNCRRRRQILRRQKQMMMSTTGIGQARLRWVVFFTRWLRQARPHQTAGCSRHRHSSSPHPLLLAKPHLPHLRRGLPLPPRRWMMLRRCACTLNVIFSRVLALKSSLSLSRPHLMERCSVNCNSN